MNLPKIKCMYCASEEVGKKIIRKCVDEDKIYEGKKARFMEGYTSVTALMDNIVLQCTCKKCNGTFASLLKLNIDVESITNYCTLSDLEYIKPESLGLVVDRSFGEEDD